MIIPTYQQVLDGDQSQLRIVVKLGDVELVKPLPTDHISFHGDRMYLFHRADETREITAVRDANERTRYQVGHTYAVQPGRGMPSILWRGNNNSFPLVYTKDHTVSAKEWKQHHLNTYPQYPHPDGGWREVRIRVTGIRQERVQDISEDDVEAEGVAKQRWADNPEWPATAGYAALWDAIHAKRGERWADNPWTWVLEFELVREAVSA